MKAHQVVLRRVGLVLIAIGVIDIGIMIYCIVNKLSYSSSFNIFSLIAGILLYRGHLGTAKFLTSASAFFFAGFVTVVLLFPFFTPLKIWAFYFQDNPIQFVLSAIFVGLVIYAMYWVNMQLQDNSVLEARRAVGHSISKPKLAFIFGAAIPALLLVLLLHARFGETGKIAISLAKDVVGEGYEFHIESFNSQGSSGSATVVAYNDSEYKKINVNW